MKKSDRNIFILYLNNYFFSWIIDVYYINHNVITSIQSIKKLRFYWTITR